MSNRRFLLLSASNNGGGGTEIEFYLSYNSEILKYTAMSNMTWAEFIDNVYYTEELIKSLIRQL